MREKILLVDDERLLLDCVQRMLAARFDISTACGPEEALDIVGAHGPFAVVVSDFTMPRLNGLELLEKVKAIHPSTVGILLSGNANSTSPQFVNNPVLFRILEKPC